MFVFFPTLCYLAYIVAYIVVLIPSLPFPFTLRKKRKLAKKQCSNTGSSEHGFIETVNKQKSIQRMVSCMCRAQCNRQENHCFLSLKYAEKFPVFNF